MVFDVEVFGAQRSKPSNSISISSTVLMLTPDSQTFPKISSLVWGLYHIEKGNRRRAKSIEWLAFGKEMESLICSLSAAFSCEHSQWNFIFSLEWEYPCSEWKCPGTFSERIHSIFSPQSSVSGRATRGRSRPLSVSFVVSTGISFSLTV